MERYLPVTYGGKEGSYEEPRLKEVLSYGNSSPEPDEKNGLVGTLCKMVK